MVLSCLQQPCLHMAVCSKLMADSLSCSWLQLPAMTLGQAGTLANVGWINHRPYPHQIKPHKSEASLGINIIFW